MSEPVLRAHLDTGETYDDPADDLLFEIIEEIARHRAIWVSVEKLADFTGETYARVERLSNGVLQVDRRLGADAEPEFVRLPGLHLAHEALVAWVRAL